MIKKVFEPVTIGQKPEKSNLVLQQQLTIFMRDFLTGIVRDTPHHLKMELIDCRIKGYEYHFRMFRASLNFLLEQRLGNPTSPAEKFLKNLFKKNYIKVSQSDLLPTEMLVKYLIVVLTKQMSAMLANVDLNTWPSMAAAIANMFINVAQRENEQIFNDCRNEFKKDFRAYKKSNRETRPRRIRRSSGAARAEKTSAPRSSGGAKGEAVKTLDAAVEKSFRPEGKVCPEKAKIEVPRFRY